MWETKEKLVPDRWAGWCSCRTPNLLHGSINELSSLITLPLGVRSEVMLHWIIAVYFHKADHSVLKTMFIKTLTSLIWLCLVPVLEKRGGQVRQWQCGRIYVDTLYFIWSAGILSQWPVTRTHTHLHTLSASLKCHQSVNYYSGRAIHPYNSGLWIQSQWSTYAHTH